MRHAKKIAVLFATLFFLTAAAVFAMNTQADNAGGKVIPPGWCRVHGEIYQMSINQRLMCRLCFDDDFGE